MDNALDCFVRCPHCTRLFPSRTLRGGVMDGYWECKCGYGFFPEDERYWNFALDSWPEYSDFLDPEYAEYAWESEWINWLAKFYPEAKS